jgi:hypothetical protein
MIDRVVFVYVKDQQIKAVYLDDALSLEDDPEWEHIASLDARSYIQHVLEQNPVLVSRMRGDVDAEPLA